MNRFILLCFSFLFFALPAAQAEYFGKIDKKIWSLDAPNGFTRWLILREQAKGQHGDLYHVEVLELKDGAKPWEFKRLEAHMALTENALRWSIGRAMSKGDVYPETFDNAYAMWKEERKPPICKTNISDCLKNGDK